MTSRQKMTVKKRKSTEQSKASGSSPTDESSLFQDNSQYIRYLQIKDRKIEPLRCMSDKLFSSTHLPDLLDKYQLDKFLCFKANAYPRLVKMFYANLGLADDKVSCYVLEKHIVIDVDCLAELFGMDPTAPRLTAGSFENYSKEEAINLLFPYSTPRDASGKLLITGLSPEDRILHYILCKVLIPRATNFTQIVEDELFLMWVIKNQLDFNMPYFIIKYLSECSKRSDIGFLPYGMLLTPVFEKAKLKIKEEAQVSLINSTTMITASNLHKMHLEQDEQGVWKRKRGLLPLPSQSTQGASGSGGAQPDFEAFQTTIIDEMKNLHIHLIDQFNSINAKLDTHSEKLDQLSEDHQGFRDSFSAMNDRFNTLESQVSVIEAKLQEKEEEDELRDMDFDPPPS